MTGSSPQMAPAVAGGTVPPRTRGPAVAAALARAGRDDGVPVDDHAGPDRGGGGAAVDGPGVPAERARRAVGAQRLRAGHRRARRPRWARRGPVRPGAGLPAGGDAVLSRLGRLRGGLLPEYVSWRAAFLLD